MRMGNTPCTGRLKEIVLKALKVDISTKRIYDTFALERHLTAERVFEKHKIDIKTKQILNTDTTSRFEVE